MLENSNAIMIYKINFCILFYNKRERGIMNFSFIYDNKEYAFSATGACEIDRCLKVQVERKDYSG